MRAEHQDIVTVNLVQQPTQAKSQQLRLCHVQPKSARTQPGVDVRETWSELVNCLRDIFDECTYISHGVR